MEDGAGAPGGEGDAARGSAEPAGVSAPPAHGGIIGYAIAFGLAAILIAWLYPPAFLAGHAAHFSLGDVPQHVAGWLLYAEDGWRFPLLKTTHVAPPEGISIAVTDSIPLAALLFKPFTGLLPEGFHYFGLWHVVLRLSQALAAVYLVRSLGATSALAAAAAAALALLWPAALSRIDHTALGTHAVILMALGFHFRALRDGWPLPRLALAFGLLSAVSLLVHPYLAAMALAICAASLADTARRRGVVAAALLSALCIGLSLAAVAWVCGYFGVGGVPPEPGHFSMNLLAPVCGGGLTLCPAFDATGGQYEGYNYLGLGGIAVVVLGFWSGRGAVGAALRRHAALVLVLAGLAVYALSVHVYLAYDKILEYTLPFGLEAVAGMFRATGRFFWPVGYALLFGGLALLLNRRRPWTAWLLLAAVCLQAVEVYPIMQRLRERSFAADFYDFRPWRDFPPVTFVDVFPAYGCGEVENAKYVYFERVAAQLDVPINTAYVARLDRDCSVQDRAPASIEDGRLSVYLDPPGHPRHRPAAFEAAVAAGDCAEYPLWGGDLICYRGATAADWQALGLELTPLPAQ